MPDNENQGSAGGPAIIQATAAHAIDLLSDQLLKRVKENGGGLTAPDIRAVIKKFKSEPDSMLDEAYSEAWQQCLAHAESAHWTTARKFHFERIMVKSFADLLPKSHETIQAGRHLSRRIIPGFIYALQQMMGQETYSQHGDRTKTLVDTLRAVHGDSFTWDEVYADPTCQDVVEEVLVDIAQHFGDMAKRRNWMIDIIDTQMPASSIETEQAWTFDDAAFHTMMNMLYSDLRDKSHDPRGQQDLQVRYGKQKVAILETLLGGLQRDHADLMKAGRL